MKKFFTTALLVVFGTFVLNAAKAELNISGYQEFYAVSIDQTTAAGLDQATQTDNASSGLSNGRFTRITATGTSTLDNGMSVTGVLNVSKDGAASGDTDTNSVAVNENSLSLSGGFGTISVGNVFSAGTMIHHRGTTLIPTAEPDNNVYGFYPTAGGAAGGYGAFDEAGYAMDGMKIRYMSNVYEGFSMAISYESCQEKDTGNASAADCNGGTVADYDDIIDVGIAYSGSFDGIDIGLTAGQVTGNTQILAGAEYNDYEASIYSAKVGFAGVTAIYKYMSYGDSGQLVSSNADGDGEGNVYAIRYDMGNISLGYIKVETEYKHEGNASMSSQEQDIFGVGYNLGGGVLFEVSHGSKEEIGGADSLKDTEADITIAKISFGF
jgi:hypothetical protein